MLSIYFQTFSEVMGKKGSFPLTQFLLTACPVRCQRNLLNVLVALLYTAMKNPSFSGEGEGNLKKSNQQLSAKVLEKNHGV